MIYLLLLFSFALSKSDNKAGENSMTVKGFFNWLGGKQPNPNNTDMNAVSKPQKKPKSYIEVLVKRAEKALKAQNLSKAESIISNIEDIVANKKKYKAIGFWEKHIPGNHSHPIKQKKKTVKLTNTTSVHQKPPKHRTSNPPLQQQQPKQKQPKLKQPKQKQPKQKQPKQQQPQQQQPKQPKQKQPKQQQLQQQQPKQQQPQQQQPQQQQPQQQQPKQPKQKQPKQKQPQQQQPLQQQPLQQQPKQQKKKLTKKQRREQYLREHQIRMQQQQQQKQKRKTGRPRPRVTEHVKQHDISSH